jgi:hypothetical protein
MTNRQPKVEPISSSRCFWFAVVGFLTLTLLMFGDVLFASGDTVLSSVTTDTFGQFLSWRKFGFEELKKGNLALWNPYVFCGAPYFGGFQAALLYPLNALFLFLPVTTAINYCIALHVFLAGVFVYLWASGRRLHPLACFFAGVIWMFCGPYFLHLYAGHLSNLCTIIWAPLLLLSIDRAIEKPGPATVLLGMAVVAMQILAGHPQYVFYTNFIGGCYFLLRLEASPRKAKTLCCFFLIYVGAVALSSVQLFTGAQAARESIRSLGISRAFAGIFSLPPENLLTLIAPEFFGGIKGHVYWGRWLFWEMCLFSGVTAFILAAFGMIGGYNRERSVIALILLVSCLLALGDNTRLFDLFYNYVPGFDHFRGWAKFSSLMSLFLALLSGMGLDDIIRKRRPIRRLLVTVSVFAFCLGITAWLIAYSSQHADGLWRNFTRAIAATGQSRIPLQVSSTPQFLQSTGRHAAVAVGVAAAVAFVFVLLLALKRASRHVHWLIVLLGAGEIFIFARSYRVSFDANKAMAASANCFNYISGDARTFFKGGANLPMYYGKGSIWGNDPGIPLRYAELLASTQNVKLDSAAEFDLFREAPFFRALRCHFVIKQVNQHLELYARSNTLPQLNLISDYRVLSQKQDIFTELEKGEFDPGKEVILETEPSVKPDRDRVSGEVKLTASSTDFLEVEADLPSAAILLVTDSYTPSWRAFPLPGSSQSAYELLPADYCLRAIPLAAGHHKLRMEYSSKGFMLGKWLSLWTLIAYLGVLTWYFAKRQRTRLLSLNEQRG